MIYLKYLLFTTIVYLVTLSGSLVTYFAYIKNDIVKSNHQIDSFMIKNFELQVEKYILNNEFEKIDILLKDLKNTKRFDYVQIDYTDYYITVDSILKHSDNIKTRDWVLSDISMDVKYGELIKFNETTFQFKQDEDYEFINDIEIKFQALNENNMQNSISNINFLLPTFSKTDIVKEKDVNLLKDKISEILNLNIQNKETVFFIDGINKFSTVFYTLNNNSIYKDLTKALYIIVIYFNILFFTILFLIILSNYYLLRTRFINHLRELEVYTNDIVINKFYKYDVKQLQHKDISNIAIGLGKISKKMASIINELNVNRGTIELQVSTDTLTKLPNSKIFEQDMKGLFLADIQSYVITVRLECLKQFAQDNSQVITDRFIIDFVDKFQIAIKNIDDKHIKSYRFYGSEFLLIAKYTNYNKAMQLLELMIENISNLNEQYSIKDKIVHAVAIPFDHYSTTDKLLAELNELGDSTRDKIVENSFHAVDMQEVDEEDSKLERIVTSIIKNDAFSLSYRFNTYLFNEPDILTMQEVSPNLLDTDGTTIPIGTFISVAEHQKVATDFDKQLIIKAFKYIKQKKITHDLAINISISALQDSNFTTWLESKLLYDYKNIINNVVFSVTTFAVKNNFDLFVQFTKDIHKFNGRILLKRFSYNDLTLEQLELMDLDFIRVHKDYTTNVDEHRVVILKNIINFSVIHNVKVLGDIVSNEKDYKTLKSLKFYATSKEDYV